MLPRVWFSCQFLIGLLAITWAFSSARSSTSPRWEQRFPLVLLCLPLYAALQAVPLPLPVVQALSPVRAELHESVSFLAEQALPWTPLSVDPAATREFALRLAAYTVVYWIARGLSTRLARFQLAVATPVLVVAVIQSTIAVGQQFFGGPASGSYVNRNHLAGLLEMSLPFAVVAAFTMGRHALRHHTITFAASAAVAGATAVLILAGILATRSRAGLLAALVSLMVLSLASLGHLTRSRRSWLLVPLLPALAAASLLYLPSQNLVRRYGALFGGESLLREGRVLLWRETLDLIAAYPLVGCGFGGYEPAFLRYKNSAPMVSDTHAHNDYLELIAEVGVIGFALCAVLGAPAVAKALRASRRHGFRQNPLALACAGSLAAILLHSFFDFNLRIPANGMLFFWVLGIFGSVSMRDTA
jgi:O-antigen ligase